MKINNIYNQLITEGIIPSNTVLMSTPLEMNSGMLILIDKETKEVQGGIAYLLHQKDGIVEVDGVVARVKGFGTLLHNVLMSSYPNAWMIPTRDSKIEAEAKGIYEKLFYGNEYQAEPIDDINNSYYKEEYEFSKEEFLNYGYKMVNPLNLQGITVDYHPKYKQKVVELFKKMY